VEVGAPSSGVGATQTWTEPRGKGKLWITRVDEPREVAFSLRFANFPQMDNVISLGGDDGQTIVTWNSASSLPPGPFYGWFGFLYSSGLEAQFRQSLQRLEGIVEQSPE
jgi:hypothetical protein